MFSFRQKIFISYLLIFSLFLVLLFPLSSILVKKIVITAMENRSREVIDRIEHTPSNEALVKSLKEMKALIFFRVSVITNEKKVLYDTHTKRVIGPRFSQEYIVDHPEVNEAFQKGLGYHEDYSEILGQEFAYMAVAFDFHGKTYVLRTAFPYRYIIEMKSDFEIGFLTVATIILLLFSTMSWIIINHFTRPIQEIISLIRPYQEGRDPNLPYIHLPSLNERDEFKRLADTLNSLNSQIQRQINTLKQTSAEKAILLESLTEGVIAFDSSLLPTFANQAALRFLALPSIEENSLKKSHPKLSDLAAKCQKEGKLLTDSLEVHLPHTRFYLDVVAAPKKDRSGALLVLQDKTRDVKILKMRQDFIANASHELKTPVAIIQGYAELLHDGSDLPLETKQGATEKILRNCQRMTFLIKDLLALADIEDLPESRIEEIDLVELAEKSRETVLSIYKDANITISKNADSISIECDPNLIEMALNNLLDNGSKYSAPPAVIELSLQETGERVVIQVKDHGVGISKEHLERIFERFYRVDPSSAGKKTGSSGLGLSIVQTIVEKHFGNISVASEKGVGTIFTIDIPKKRRS